MTQSPFLPYGRQTIDESDIAAVAQVLRSGMLTTGPAVGAFEEALARVTGARHVVSCSSGTAALHLAALALKLGPGDSAIVPTVTFLATANAIRYVGAEVLFADVDPVSGLMNPAQFEEALHRSGADRVKAVFPVHLNGQGPDMPAIAVVARDQGLAVVEDVCHALGSTYLDDNGQPVAAGGCHHGDMGIFSFHPVKTIAMGEGGAVTTNDSALQGRLARLRNHGMHREATEFSEADHAFDQQGEANPWYYEMPEIGFNYRASDLQCALGLSQLGKLAIFARRRRELAARYDRLIAPLAPLVKPVGRQPGTDPVWHLYVVRIDFDALQARLGPQRDRGWLMRALAERGVGTQVHYLPVHLQPYYRRRYGEISLPGSWRYYQSILSLPLFPAMADTDVDRVVEALAELLGLGS